MTEIKTTKMSRDQAKEVARNAALAIASLTLCVIGVVMLPSFIEAPQDTQAAWLVIGVVVAAPLAYACFRLEPGEKRT